MYTLCEIYTARKYNLDTGVPCVRMIVEAVRMRELTEREEIPNPKLQYATCSN